MCAIGTIRPTAPATTAAVPHHAASLRDIADAADTAWLTPHALDPLDVLARVPSGPASAVFTGTVRADAHVREVVALDYEAYAGMAEREMARICAEAADRFGAHCAMAHRTGPVGVGEPSVAAAATAPADAVALAACRWMVDRLKERVPVWKLQRFADGGTEWLEGA